MVDDVKSWCSSKLQNLELKLSGEPRSKSATPDGENVTEPCSTDTIQTDRDCGHFQSYPVKHQPGEESQQPCVTLHGGSAEETGGATLQSTDEASGRQYFLIQHDIPSGTKLQPKPQYTKSSSKESVMYQVEMKCVPLQFVNLLSLSIMVVSEDWRTDNIAPLFKKVERDKLNNYKPAGCCCCWVNYWNPF